MSALDVLRLMIVFVFMVVILGKLIAKLFFKGNPITTKFIARTAAFSAISILLYTIPFLKFSLPIFPAFLEIHLDEIPAFMFCPLILLPEHDLLQHGFSGFRNLDIQVVVADKAENGTIAVDAVVAHHFSNGYLTGAGALIYNELNKIRIAGHYSRCFVILHCTYGC